MAKMTYGEKKKLPKKSFAEPGKRKYPIQDEAHARNALARVSQSGTPEEKAVVRKKVAKKFPGITQSKGPQAKKKGK